MTSTFLGKWRFHLPSREISYQFSTDGWAAYKASGGHQNPIDGWCVWYTRYDNADGPYPPGRETNTALILRADGQLCFLLNTGKYVGFRSDIFPFVDTLDQATGFAFPGFDFHNLPAQFNAPIQTNGDGTLLGDLWGALMAGQTQATGIVFNNSLVTPPFPSVQASGNGDGLDFQWVDLTGGALNKVVNLKG